MATLMYTINLVQYSRGISGFHPVRLLRLLFSVAYSGEPASFSFLSTRSSQLARLHARTKIELVLFAGADDSPVLLPPHLARHISHAPADLLQL
jgi:hypothetical protein